MTPQERQLVDELFDRLSRLEDAPRDRDAERAIEDGLKQAPHAVYALVQTTLVQDEALKRANARIQELQAQLGDEPQQQPPPGGFLDNMRDALFGPREPRGSVPSVRPQGSQSPFAAAPGYQSPTGYPQQGPAPGYPQGPAPGYPPQPPYGGPGFGGPGFGTGGSFLGTAASTAAGVIGGALLLDGIRSMFGGRHGAASGSPSAFGGVGDQPSPWAGSAANSDLARDTGINDIGRSDDTGNNQGNDRAGLFDTADSGSASDNVDYGDDEGGDYGGDGGGDSDYA